MRESLFNIIARDVPGATVLDLFAGSGALALEALSRGAEYAVLADKARLATECIRRNIDTLGFGGQAAFIQADWRKALRQKFERPFDLVFLDPPYSLTLYREITDMLNEYELLANDALIVIEHRRNEAIALSPLFISTDHRPYGETEIHFYRFQAGGQNNEV